MNIKSKQFRIFGATLSVALLSLVTVVSFSAPVSASPQTDVTAYCKKTAKKAVASCPKAAEQAINKASYNCKKATKKEKCITTKAKGYIKTAAKAKNDTEFKKSLKKKLDSVKGSSETPYTAAYAPGAGTSFYGGSAGEYQCGGDDTEVVTTKIDFGCLGPDDAPEDMGPITDMAFAIIRFLSAGVGIVIVGSIIFAGIQYSSSEGSPEATQAAKSRVRNSLIGLLIYIFGFSIIQFLVPGGLFAT